MRRSSSSSLVHAAYPESSSLEATSSRSTSPQSKMQFVALSAESPRGGAHKSRVDLQHERAPSLRRRKRVEVLRVACCVRPLCRSTARAKVTTVGREDVEALLGGRGRGGCTCTGTGTGSSARGLVTSKLPASPFSPPIVSAELWRIGPA